jgi:hypothetical protein
MRFKANSKLIISRSISKKPQVNPVEAKNPELEPLENKFISWVFSNISPQVFISNLKYFLADVYNLYPPFNSYYWVRKEKKILDMKDYQAFLRIGDGLPAIMNISPYVFIMKPFNLPQGSINYTAVPKCISAGKVVCSLGKHLPDCEICDLEKQYIMNPSVLMFELDRKYKKAKRESSGVPPIFSVLAKIKLDPEPIKDQNIFDWVKPEEDYELEGFDKIVDKIDDLIKDD